MKRFFSLLLLTMVIACTGSKTITNSSTDTKDMAEKAVETVKENASSIDMTAILDDISKKNIPLDPSVRTGSFSNGLKYYIQKNAKPENRVELRLALNAGSLQENDAQQGLAHFCEHMCFNGTKNFEKNEIINFFEEAGMKFGAHANAYTSFDETVYMLQLPMDKPEILDNGFQVLEDWAAHVSFESEEIDKERGVVISEWRTRLSAEQRMREKSRDVTFYNSRYAKRFPIGKVDILENFEHETLRQFYRDWYRPDLMAIVVVGDVDLDDMEARIKKHFEPLTNPENAPKREMYPVPDHKETLVSIETDKEATFTIVNIDYKHPKKTTKTVGDYRKSLMTNLYNNMLNDRLEELKQSSAEPPFSWNNISYGAFTRTKNSYGAFAATPETGILRGIEALATENERVLRHGFTQSELDRQKKSLLRGLETGVKEKDKTESGRLASRYVQHFLSGSPVPSPEERLNMGSTLLKTISLKDVNTLAAKFITDENVVITVTAPEKEGVKIPTKAEVLNIFKAVKTADIKAYEDKAVAESFIASTPTPAKIMDEKAVEEIDVTELTFANGVKVILKPTTFKNDEIMFAARSWGGDSQYSDAEYFSASFSSDVVDASGISEFSSTDMQKMLAGKKLRLSPYVSGYSEGMSGACSPEDLETFLQLVHLYFTKPRKDETAFQGFKAQNKSIYQNLLQNPQYYFFNESNRAKYNNHLRAGGFPSNEDFEKINFDRTHEIYAERFADANDFTFYMLGNFDMTTLKPLLATYLGTLPTKEGKEMWKDYGIKMVKGQVRKDFKKGSDPKSFVEVTYHGDFDQSAVNRHRFISVVDVLRIKLRESLREDKGGVYGVGVSGSANRLPKETYEITFSFNSDPENTEDLLKTALEVVRKVRDEGITAEDMQKITETQRRDYETNMTTNRYWMSKLQTAYTYEENASDILNVEKVINSMTLEELNATAKKYLTEENLFQIVLNPEG
ncbi:MAG: M16 family metallopeptidase [Chitinophagales bacterium]